jgi:hypothetical protein
MFKKLKRDSWTLGIILGVALPLLVYGIVLFIMMQWGTVHEGVYVLKPSTMKLVAIFSNLITFRYYMVNLKYDRTGRGILLVTFLMAGVFFYLYL